MAYSDVTVGNRLDEEPSRHFYREVLSGLNARDVPYMVGGSFAAAHYTGRTPHTKDLDIFVSPDAVHDALETLAELGFDTEVTYPYWIAKACRGSEFIDLIFRAASGLWEVESDWIKRAEKTEMWGVEAPICAAEELIWTKAALMDRDRYDGNDVLHLFQAKAHELDWERMRTLAGDDWRLLLAHLTLFGYVYPDLNALIPHQLLAELSLRLINDKPDEDRDDDAPICRGTLISNTQYLLDVEELGYRDARLEPIGTLSVDDLRPWVEAVKRGDT